MSIRIEVPQEAIAAFSRRHRIRKLAFFGSVLREDFTPESDVDVLVEFEPGARVGLNYLFGYQRNRDRLADMNEANGSTRITSSLTLLFVKHVSDKYAASPSRRSGDDAGVAHGKTRLIP